AGCPMEDRRLACLDRRGRLSSTGKILSATDLRSEEGPGSRLRVSARAAHHHSAHEGNGVGDVARHVGRGRYARRSAMSSRAILSAPKKFTEAAMEGLMQDFPLTLHHILWRVERLFPRKEIVTLRAGGLHRTTFGSLAARTRQLANALIRLGVKP